MKQLDRALSKVQNGTALCWTRLTTSIGQVVNSRGSVEVGHMDWEQGGMAQVELRDDTTGQSSSCQDTCRVQRKVRTR